MNAHLGLRRLGATVSLALLTQAAYAHDSWFAALPRTDRGEAVFAFGTGNRFPLQETGIPFEQVQALGCQGKDHRATPMRWVADRPTALVLRSARSVAQGTALSCWAQLQPLQVDIDDSTVDVYLKEVNALPAVRERWAALRAKGVRWQETYTKFARIELGSATDTSGSASEAPQAIAGAALDLVMESPAPLRAGDTLRVRLLRDGQPLAGLPLELRSDLSPLGIWRQTDADGRISVPVPLAANWLLRGTDLRAAAMQPDTWDSRFITLAFEVLPRR